MELFETIKTRRSIRSFSDRPVSAELADKIAEAGTYAATGMNMQSPLIIEISDKTLRDRLSKMNAAVMGRDGDPFYGAPLVFAVIADKNAPTHVYDGSLVIGNMMLAAHALGLGSCWIHRAKEEFESDEGKEILRSLGITGDYEGIGHLVVGYIEGELPEARPRKDGYVVKVRC